MAEPMSRQEALARLAVPASADVGTVKRAYRRLARATHPDAGGDPDAFRDLQLAYERLVTSPAGERARSRRPVHGRPSRRRGGATAADPDDPDAPVPLDEVDWAAPWPTGDGLVALDPALLARALVGVGEGPVHPVAARSRGPRAVTNRWLHLLADDLAATLRVGPARDRGRRGTDVEVALQAWSRRGRRRLEAATLPEPWLLTRGSDSTTVVRVLPPSAERRATAVRTARAIGTALDGLGWPLASWYVPAGGRPPED